MMCAVALASSCATAPPAAAPASCSHELETAEAAFANGDIALAGAWITPRGVSRAPAIVILQGSGTSDRNNAWAAMIAHELASCGIAVLLTDKRGSGRSGGDWRTSSMLDLAADGAAALAWAAGQDGVDRDRIGFLGLSQGGQVAPAAATLAPETDFIVSWVSSVGPMKQALLYELEQTYRQHGLDDASIALLQNMARASFTWLETGEGWDRYIALRSELASGPLARGVESWPTEQDHSYWTFWRLNGGYDALPYWRAATEDRGMPALSILGADDALDNVDVTSTARLLANHASAVRVIVLPGVGHSLRTDRGDIHPTALERTRAMAFAAAPGSAP